MNYEIDSASVFLLNSLSLFDRGWQWFKLCFDQIWSASDAYGVVVVQFEIYRGQLAEFITAVSFGVQVHILHDKGEGLAQLVELRLSHVLI